jgi:hypothetical protein
LNSRRDKGTFEIVRTTCKAVLGLWICVLLAGPNVNAAESTAEVIAAPLTASQVVSRMGEMNERRAEALRGYTSVRSYHLELHGMIKLHADMEVKMAYHYPGDKDFTILSESGSGYIRDHVLKRLIKAENESSHQGENRQVAITPENYDFELAGYEPQGKDGYYILKVTPRVKRKYLFKGRIWIDDQNFAIVRIEGEPAKAPSWWTTKVNFVAQYKRVGDFWLPAVNKSVTSVRVFGQSLLTIEYKDYSLSGVTDVHSAVPPRLHLGDHAPDSDPVPRSTSSE